MCNWLGISKLISNFKRFFWCILPTSGILEPYVSDKFQGYIVIDPLHEWRANQDLPREYKKAVCRELAGYGLLPRLCSQREEIIVHDRKVAAVLARDNYGMLPEILAQEIAIDRIEQLNAWLKKMRTIGDPDDRHGDKMEERN